MRNVKIINHRCVQDAQKLMVEFFSFIDDTDYIGNVETGVISVDDKTMPYVRFCVFREESNSITYGDIFTIRYDCGITAESQVEAFYEWISKLKK